MGHPVPSSLQTSLLPMPIKTPFEKKETNLDSYEKTIQKIKV
jgi:hypothetical protein